MSLLSRSFDVPWLDVMSLVVAATLLEAAVTGRGTTRGRRWQVAPWLQPIFAVVGFVVLAFGLTDLFRRLLR